MTVDAERWQEVKRLFNEAVGLEGDARTALLADVRASTPELAADVESLLEWDARPGSPLDSGAAAAVSSDDVADDALIGRELGSWRLVSIIGRGGMGIVYLAERADAAFRMPAAVKVVRHGGDTVQILKRFHQERETLAGLDHPNIARLFDGGTTPQGQPYLVMEFVDGVPIDRYCDDRQLTVDARLTLFRQVCDAVRYAHQNLVVHRDIKPDNILVTNDGTPKLLDFGVAKLLTLGETTPGDEFAPTWLLTPEYASPEQLRGLPVTTASDVYSLGVLLHVLLTGRRPYVLSGTNVRALQAQLGDVSLRKPSELASGDTEASHAHAFRRRTTPARLASRLSGDLDAILLKTMEPGTARRYGSVEPLSADLERHRTLRPVEARAPSRTYVLGLLVRRHREAIGVAAVALILMAPGVAAIVRQTALTAEARVRAERRFADVRRLAQSFMFDVHDAIVNVPGTTEGRALLVRTTVTYLDSLAGEAVGDRELQRELAAAYVKVGDAQGHPTSANLGDTAGARASYLRAIAIADALIAEQANDVEAGRTLAMAHRRLADVLAWGGDPAGALTHAERSQRLFAVVAARPAATVEDRLQAIIGDIKLGDLQGNPNFPNLNRRDEAIRRYDVALAALRPLAASAPGNERVKRYVGLGLERLGTMHEAAEQWGEAERVYRESFALRSALAAQVRLHVDIQRDLAVAYEKLANIQRARGDGSGAVASYRGALAQFERLAQTDPQNAIAARSVGISRERLADTLASLARTGEALDLLRAALGTYRRLGERDPDNAQTRCDRGRVAERLADLLATASGREACSLWQESLDVTKELVAIGTATCVSSADPERLTLKRRGCP